MFKRHERKQYEQKDEFTGNTYVHTIHPIANIVTGKQGINYTGFIFFGLIKVDGEPEGHTESSALIAIW